MLLICSGPDTFRAQAKARVLEQAFREKYDTQGLSVERLEEGKDALQHIAGRGATMSLFATRRLVRVRNLFENLPKTGRATLVRVLSGDQDHFILLTVEDSPVSEDVLSDIRTSAKVVVYPFPELSGSDFRTWVRERAAELEIHDTQAIDALALRADGDSWYAWNELMKRAAWSGALFDVEEERSATLFERAEQYLSGRERWLSILADQDMQSQAMTTFLSQARFAIRVRDGSVQGIHPFVVKKMRALGLSDVETRFASVLQALFLQRSGFGTESDVLLTLLSNLQTR